MYFRSAVLFALLTVALPAASNAQERPGVLRLLPSDSVTQHEATIGGRRLDYTATAGTLDLFGQDGSQTGAIFYTAYIAKDGAANRPITFAFNGGPGAASAFLHLGLVGPRVLDFGPQARDGTNAKLVDNPQSWLDFTDLVLIDPIGTGSERSRTAKADDASNYYNVNADAQSMAKAIALYAAHNNRSDSPKYLLGESYGGFRAAKVAAALQQSQGVIVSGAVMLSPLLEGQLMFNADQFALGAALEFPSLVAAEAERRKTFDDDAAGCGEVRARRLSDDIGGACPDGGRRERVLWQGLGDDRHSGRTSSAETGVSWAIPLPRILPGSKAR